MQKIKKTALLCVFYALNQGNLSLNRGKMRQLETVPKDPIFIVKQAGY
jgi:hypothetical protein